MKVTAYELVLEPMSSDVPVELRLRKLLKSALRNYRFRCRSVTEKKVTRIKDEVASVVRRAA